MGASNRLSMMDTRSTGRIQLPTGVSPTRKSPGRRMSALSSASNPLRTSVAMSWRTSCASSRHLPVARGDVEARLRLVAALEGQRDTRARAAARGRRGPRCRAGRRTSASCRRKYQPSRSTSSAVRGLRQPCRKPEARAPFELAVRVEVVHLGVVEDGEARLVGRRRASACPPAACRCRPRARWCRGSRAGCPCPPAPASRRAARARPPAGAGASRSGPPPVSHMP